MDLTEKIEPNIMIYNSMLAILLRLITDKTPLIFTRKDYDGNFNDVLILAQEMKALYYGVNYSYDKTNSVLKLSFNEMYLPKLLNSLDVYLEKVVSNKITSDSVSIYDWESLNNEFIESVKGKILTDYNLSSVKYMHIVLLEYLRGNIYIKKVRLWFNKDCDKEGSSRIFPTDNECSESWNDDFIKCILTIDITKYVNKYTSKVSTKANSNKSSKDKQPKGNRKFLKLLLEVLLAKLKNGNETIPFEEIDEIRIKPTAKTKNIEKIETIKTKLATRVSNRISKVRKLYKELSCTNNNLLEVAPYVDYEYEIIASEEQILKVIEKLKTK